MRVARVLFARVPEHGRVKSRLAVELGEDAAYALYRWLLRVQGRVFAGKPDRDNSFSNFVYYAPSVGKLKARLKFYPDLNGFSIKFRPQCEGDLGLRLTQACIEVLRHHDLALIWGADIPVLPQSIESQAIALSPRSVITLARDGGYAFLSVAREKFNPAMFEQIRWSTSVTGRDQIHALKKTGLDVVVSGKVTDLDRLKDFTRILRELEAAGRTEDLADFTRTVNLFSH